MWVEVKRTGEGSCYDSFYTRKHVVAKPATRFCRESQFSSKRVCIPTALHAFRRFHEFFPVGLLKTWDL